MKRSAAVLVFLSACRPSTMTGPDAPAHAMKDEASATVVPTETAVVARDPGPPAQATPDPGPVPPAAGSCPAGMVELAGGTFRMGADEDDAKIVPPIAVPAREGTAAAFCLEYTEVTTAAYARCVEDGACTEPATGTPCNYGLDGREDHPINCIDFYEAQAYCAYRQRRLPTEEEWEFAAREETGRLYPWGDADPLEVDGLMSFAATPGMSTRPVLEFPAGNTPGGIADLAGNVWEWTSSPACMHDDEGCASRQRVIKGGHDNPFAAQSFNRFFVDRAHVAPDLGFRCAGPGTAEVQRPKPRRKPVNVHWSQLRPRDPVRAVLDAGGPPPATRPICMVRVELNARGEPQSARANPGAEQSVACTPQAAEIAETAVLDATWWPTAVDDRRGPVNATLPVFLEHPQDD